MLNTLINDSGNLVQYCSKGEWSLYYLRENKIHIYIKKKVLNLIRFAQLIAQAFKDLSNSSTEARLSVSRTLI